jgi:hypothetical protein
LEKVTGSITASTYLDIIKNDLPRTCDWYGLGLGEMVFQQDNAPCHTALSVRSWLQLQSFQVLDWPPQSPDLNPIEHAWGILKRKLGSYESAPANLDELWTRVQSEWEKYNTGSMLQSDCQYAKEDTSSDSGKRELY